MTVRLVALVLVLAARTVSAQGQFYYLGNPDEDAPQGSPTDEPDRALQPEEQAVQPEEYE